MKVSGLAGILGIPDVSVTSALREANINVQDEEDPENEIFHFHPSVTNSLIVC